MSGKRGEIEAKKNEGRAHSNFDYDVAGVEASLPDAESEAVIENELGRGMLALVASNDPKLPFLGGSWGIIGGPFLDTEHVNTARVFKRLN